ncbi:thioredoxin [Candidatus Woesearchaeota archaeon]|jgi:thioredoxin 1|nr:thioredoxin [Candidatus Woesearchaeota archaeon]MBT6519828.1 thioredoxin [Candidatus Woesearchaeota archaeon]MBT7368207.1 thioredoxin [Candidatus Woesearchaeota archaeon]
MTVVHATKENFEQEVKNADEPVLVDFFASWCGPCNMLAPVFEELSGEYEGKLKFAKVSTESDGEIAEEYAVRGIPCLIVMKDGKEVDRIVGFSPKEALKKKVDEILGSM